jgi:hypothetical protein
MAATVAGAALEKMVRGVIAMVLFLVLLKSPVERH